MIRDPLAEPRRIAFAGDWHANATWAEDAIDYARQQGAEVIVHLGDFGYQFNPHTLSWITNSLDAAGIPLLFVDGNHERFPTLLRYPIGDNGLRQLTDRIWHLPRGFRWMWGGIRFLALGGAYSVDRPWRRPGVSWWPEELITPQQAKRTIERGPADVLVSHDCPVGVDIPGLRPDLFPALEILRADEHRQLLRTVVDAVRPRQIWHGHYHQDYGRTVDFGYGLVKVTGLDCDGSSVEANVRVVDLADLRGVR